MPQTQNPHAPTSPQKGAWDLRLEKQSSQESLQRTPPRYHTEPETKAVSRKPLPSIPGLRETPELRLQGTPASPVNIYTPQFAAREAEAASFRGSITSSDYDPRAVHTPDSTGLNRAAETITALPSLPYRPANGTTSTPSQQAAPVQSMHIPTAVRVEDEFGADSEENYTPQPGLQYHAFEDSPKKQIHDRTSKATVLTTSSGSSGDYHQSQSLHVPAVGAAHQSKESVGSLSATDRGRTLSPLSAATSSKQNSPARRDFSANQRSPSSRPTSYVDLLNNVPYNQQVAPAPALHSHQTLQNAVGNAASLLDTKKTLEMYRANIKKTTDPAVQYEFAVFMVNASRDLDASDGIDPQELITEAKHILQRLSDRAYPFAQYYLGDGYFSGLFNKGKPDYDKAFPLFVAGSKHGHAEAGYRAALCYEFGWGCSKSYPKAVQFYRAAASKNHPGAATRLGLACLHGDMGLGKDKYREGLKWLKRAQESADLQYNTAPYELGRLHLKGYGEDIFKDEYYAAQLFTQSAELGHPEANYHMGQAYENGLLGCPRDAALSVHFYNGAATRGHAEAMMALCAWYMVGAEPFLEKDEVEACAWARQAADTGLAKAEYAVGYFTEMGIGCRRDPLEANVWYVRAADQGNETAKQRLAIIRAAASGDPGIPMLKAEPRSRDLAGGGGKKKFMGIF